MCYCTKLDFLLLILSLSVTLSRSIHLSTNDPIKKLWYIYIYIYIVKYYSTANTLEYYSAIDLNCDYATWSSRDSEQKLLLAELLFQFSQMQDRKKDYRRIGRVVCFVKNSFIFFFSEIFIEYQLCAMFWARCWNNKQKKPEGCSPGAFLLTGEVK